MAILSITALKNEINEFINTNGIEAITGSIMNGVLFDLVDSVVAAQVETSMGSAAPNNSTGSEGDLYFQTNVGIYRYTSGSWVLTFNFNDGILNQNTNSQTANFWISGRGRVGNLTIDNAPASANDGVRLTDLMAYMPLVGGSFSGDVQQTTSPVNSTSLITKGYVDNLVTGLSWKQAAVAISTTNITLSGLQTINSVVLAVGNIVLVNGQTDQTTNGIYTVQSGAWTRATDANTGQELVSAAILIGRGDSLHPNTQWANGNTSITIGVTNIVFNQIAGVGTYTNGTGILLTGNAFSINTTYTNTLYGQLNSVNNWYQLQNFNASIAIPYGQVVTFGNDAANANTYIGLASGEHGNHTILFPSNASGTVALVGDNVSEFVNDVGYLTSSSSSAIFNNGIASTGSDTFGLGGSLIQSTYIDQNGNQFVIADNLYDYSTYFAMYPDSLEPDFEFGVQNTSGISSFINLSTSSNTLFFQSGSNSQVVSLGTAGGIQIQDTISNLGFVYNQDYSSNWSSSTPQVIPDVGYLYNNFATSSSLGNYLTVSNPTFSGLLSGGNMALSPTGYLLFNGTSDTNWRIGYNISSYTLNTISTPLTIVTGTGSTDGFAIGGTGGVSFFELKGSNNSAFFRGNIVAANLSGTNTGDQDLTGYPTLDGTNVFNGENTFTGGSVFGTTQFTGASPVAYQGFSVSGDNLGTSPVTWTIAAASTGAIGSLLFNSNTGESFAYNYATNKLVNGSNVAYALISDILSGTVTSFAFTNANGVSGSVSNSTTTPNLTLTLGAITPTSTNGVLASTMAYLDATSSVQTQLNSKLNLSGGTLTGDVQQPNSPVNGNSLINKSYVDTAIAGIDWKTDVACLASTNITLSGEQTIDGIATSTSRVLVNGQTTASQNGIYVSGSGAWTRATDVSTGVEIETATVLVKAGTTYANTQWTCSNTTPPIVGTDAISFVQIAGAGVYTNGTGINLIGNVFSINTGYLASGSQTGYLSSSDWNTFNNKLSTPSAASTYVPYTGANSNINLGSYQLTSGGLSLTNTDGTGVIVFANQSTTPATPSSGFAKFYHTSSGIAWLTSSGYSSTMTHSGITASRVYTLPDTTGTIALLNTLSATTPVNYNNTTGVFSIQQATTSQSGYLSSTDWNTFNNKGSGTVTGGSITWPGTIYSTPTTGTVSGGVLTFAPALATQTAGYIFGNNTGSSATPVFFAPATLTAGSTVTYTTGGPYSPVAAGTIDVNQGYLFNLTSGLNLTNVASAANGFRVYNVSDQVTNYEYLGIGTSSNAYKINAYLGGTGIARPIQIGSTSTQFTVDNNAGLFSGSKINASFGTTGAGGISNYGVFSNIVTLTASSGIQAFFSLNTTINQTSSGGYRALWIPVYEQGTGSGSKILADFGLTTAATSGTYTSKWNVDHSGNVIQTGTLAFSGSTSGSVTLQTQAAAGTYNFNLPTTAGNAGQVMLSGGGGSNPMTYGFTYRGSGQVALTAGVATVSITGVTTSSQATYGFVAQGGTITSTNNYKLVCTSGTLTITAISATGTTDTTDTSTINYFVIN